jgi:putative transposase
LFNSFFFRIFESLLEAHFMKDLGCYYHITFATKYRRKSFLNYQKGVVFNVLETTCQKHGVELHSCVVEEDHVHLLAKMPPNLQISYIVNRLKSDSARIYNRLYQKKGQKVWQVSYSVATVNFSNIQQLERYFAHHEKESIFVKS